MRYTLAIVAVLLSLVVAGCGGGGTSQSYAPRDSVDTPTAAVHWLELNNNYYITTFTMQNGKKLTCVEYETNLSCNWPKFNEGSR